MPIEDEIKQSTFSSEKEKLLVNLLFTCGWVETNQQRFFKQHGISPQQYNVMRILRGQKGQSIPITAVSERMIDRMSNTSRLVDKLCKKGYVNRETCESDRRAVDLAITESGLQLLWKLDAELMDLQDKLITLTEQELIQLSTLLDKLRDKSNYEFNL
ncbi:MAG: MarR family transcriptional regulator [Flavobacteriales bacterium]|nr:MarR family transcriptional regulator [Flavobacteriales bacterium]